MQTRVKMQTDGEMQTADYRLFLSKLIYCVISITEC